MTGRDQVNFVPHMKRDWGDPELINQGVTNLVHESDKPEDQWIVDTTSKIGDWRSKTRSSYMRWSLAINGLFHAAEEYKHWSEERRFAVKTLRPGHDGPKEVNLAVWSGQETAQNHEDASKLISAYGVTDLFGCLEENVFEAYRIYLNHHPETILEGDEFKSMRQLQRKAHEDSTYLDEWGAKWEERLNNWQKKRAYDGLGRVFLAYIKHSGIKSPHWYKHTSPETWAETISGIAELRNLITHGVPEVSRELGEFSAKNICWGFDFKEGDPVTVKLHHMMGVECFMDQLLTALNASLIEKAVGPQERLKAILG